MTNPWMIGRVRPAVPGTKPLVVKDTFDVAGWPTTAGSRLVAASVRAAAADADVVGCLREGGFSPIAKANMVEFAFGTHGLNPWFGNPQNPLDADRIPGGSSSGSAVAVALGVAPLALGTDTGGSVRIPAACCGILGFKFGHQAVSMSGCWPLAPSLDSVGLLARDLDVLEDAVRILVDDHGSVANPPPLERLEVGIAPLDHAIAVRVGGSDVVPWDQSAWARLHAVASRLLVAEAYATLAPYLGEAHRLDPRTVARLAAAERDPGRVRELQHEVAVEREAYVRTFGQSVFALPVLPGDVPTLTSYAEVVLNRLTLPVNYLGLPALALPIPGWQPTDERSRIPPSLQLVGPPGGELLVLAAARRVLGSPPAGATG